VLNNNAVVTVYSSLRVFESVRKKDVVLECHSIHEKTNARTEKAVQPQLNVTRPYCMIDVLTRPYVLKWQNLDE